MRTIDSTTWYAATVQYYIGSTEIQRTIFVRLAMLGVLAKYISNTSVLRRLLFAIAYLPEDMPDRWTFALNFATGGKNGDADILTPQQVKVLTDNLKEMDEKAFVDDRSLQEELILLPKEKPLGIVLITSKISCSLCGSGLLLRKDCPSSVVVYDNEMGSIPATHYHKYCTNRKCGTTHYYGYYTKAVDLHGRAFFYDNWDTLPYFVSSRETAFSTKLMKRFDAQILMGQQSFKQCAEVYNHLHVVLEARSWTSSNLLAV